MASPSIKSGKYQVKGKSPILLSLETIPLFPRRLAAWTIEIYLVAASAVVPYSIGAYLESRSPAEGVPLHPVLASVEDAIAQTLALPRQQGQIRVTPLTNVLWWIALASPIAVTSWQLYILGKTGRTLPKRWFGIRVITEAGKSPGLLRVLLREGGGKWGLPLGVAYLLWRSSGAFPSLILLCAMSGIAIAIEAGTMLMPSRRRPFHDLMVGTVVVDAKTSYRRPRPQPATPEVTVEVQPDLSYTIAQRTSYRLPRQKLNTLALFPETVHGKQNLWLWMRRHPGTTLLICTLSGMSFVLTTFVAVQVYIQSRADFRQTEEEKNQAFLTLVNQLGVTATDPIDKRKSVILALARLDDPRAIPLLVDLLGQETNPVLMDAIGRGIESTGVKALPALKQLNQSLSNQLESISFDNAPKQRELVASRLRTTKSAIAKLMILSSGQLDRINLQRVDLSTMVTESGDFSLVLDRADLSGMNFRGAILNQGKFQGTIFSSGGEDKRLGTYDDAIADLSGSDLREANFADAFLNYVSLKEANLMYATLNRAKLSHAYLREANLSSAHLIAANLSEANLEKASLTGADLAEATFTRANLRKANLGQVRAVAADFSFANLSLSNWQGADLSGIDFHSANFYNADLSATQLTQANLQKAQLQNADLTNANLSNADMRGANVSGANFQGVVFEGQPAANSEQFLTVKPTAKSKIKLAGVDFTEAKNLSESQIDFICNNGGYHPQCSLKRNS